MKADDFSSAFFILHKIKFPNREYYISNQQTEINQKKKGIITMNSLNLSQQKYFGDLPCNFYRNMNDDILLTREQIG